MNNRIMYALSDIKHIKIDYSILSGSEILYRNYEDQLKYVTDAIMLRKLVAFIINTPAENIIIDRTCNDCGKQHGKPRIFKY